MPLSGRILFVSKINLPRVFILLYCIYEIEDDMKINLGKVSTSRGAPMGRSTFGEATLCADKSVLVQRVELSEGYDQGGAYWGMGETLWVAQNDAERQYLASGNEYEYRAFTRAKSRNEAIAKLEIPLGKLVRK
jgi:hypothetical protein